MPLKKHCGVNLSEVVHVYYEILLTDIKYDLVKWIYMLCLWLLYSMLKIC